MENIPVVPSQQTSFQQFLEHLKKQAHVLPIALLPLLSVFSDRIAPLLLVLAAFVTLVMRIRLFGRRAVFFPRFTPPLWAAVVLLIWMACSIFWSVDARDSVEQFLKVVLVVGCGSFLTLGLTDELEVDIFWPVVMSLALAFVFTFIKMSEWRDVVFALPYLSERAADPLNRTTLIIAVFVMMLVVHFWFSPKPVATSRKIAIFGLFVALLALLVNNKAHAPLLFVLISLTIAAAIWMKRSWFFVIIPIAAALTVILMPILTELAFNYGWPLKDAFNGAFATEFSTAGRIWIWHLMVEHIVHSPVIGFGLGADKMPFQPFVHPHNGALQLYANMGLIGAMIFAVWVGLGLYFLSNEHLPHKSGYVAIAAALFCIAMVSHGVWQGWWMALVMIALNTRLRLIA